MQGGWLHFQVKETNVNIYGLNFQHKTQLEKTFNGNKEFGWLHTVTQTEEQDLGARNCHPRDNEQKSNCDS